MEDSLENSIWAEEASEEELIDAPINQHPDAPGINGLDPGGTSMRAK